MFFLFSQPNEVTRLEKDKMALNLSDESLNFDQLELQVNDWEKADLDGIDISECLKDSLASESDTRCEQSMEIEEPQLEPVPAVVHRLPVKERLGKKQTPAQQRLIPRKSEIALSGSNSKPFKMKRIYYSNSNYGKSARQTYTQSGSRKKGQQMAPPLATSPLKPSLYDPASPTGPMMVPPPKINLPPPTKMNVPPPSVVKPLTDYMVKQLASELVTNASMKYQIHYNIDDIERALKTARRT